MIYAVIEAYQSRFYLFCLCTGLWYALRAEKDSRQLSALLLHNQGMTSGGLAGRDFLSFFCKEDRPRIQEREILIILYLLSPAYIAPTI